MLGIAPATLRTWDRRYGIGPSAHAPGLHRRYSPEDVARLEPMRHALVRGAGPADAARYALADRSADGAERSAVDAGRARAGGRMLRLPGAGPFARGLGRAALTLDFPGARTLLVEAIDALGVATAWDDVARPVLAAVAQRWATTGAGVEVEHLLSQSVTAAFSAHAATVVAQPGGRTVLLAGMPREQHVAAAGGARRRARRRRRRRRGRWAPTSPPRRWSPPSAARRPARWCCGRSCRRPRTPRCWRRCRAPGPGCARSSPGRAGPRSTCRRGFGASRALPDAVDAVVTATAG